MAVAADAERVSGTQGSLSYKRRLVSRELFELCSGSCSGSDQRAQASMEVDDRSSGLLSSLMESPFSAPAAC
jgi:hypothetical protein